MADRNRLRSARGLSTAETIFESLRDYTFQVEDLARLAERQRSRIILVGYLLISYFCFAAMITLYIWSRIETHDLLLQIVLAIFLGITVLGLPFIASSAISRFRQYKVELTRAHMLLSETMRFASQVTDHVEVDRIDNVLLALRLKEAEAALEHANDVLKQN